MRGLREGLVLCGLCLLGAMVRCVDLSGMSLWVDEVMTANAVRQWSALGWVGIGAKNNTLPLYFWFVSWVVSVFGESEGVLRGVSAAFGTATIPVIWWLGREVLKGRLAPMLMTAVFAVHPVHVWYSREARPYAMAFFSRS